jgi:hypothetical protein
MVVRIDKDDRKLMTDSCLTRAAAIPCSHDPLHLFEQSVIDSIENMVDFTIKPENIVWV